MIKSFDEKRNDMTVEGTCSDSHLSLSTLATFHTCHFPHLLLFTLALYHISCYTAPTKVPLNQLIILSHIFSFSHFPCVHFSLGAFDETKVKEFIVKSSTPLIQEFSQEAAKKIFKSPIQKHALVFVDTAASTHKATMDLLKPVAEAFQVANPPILSILTHYIVPSPSTPLHVLPSLEQSCIFTSNHDSYVIIRLIRVKFWWSLFPRPRPVCTSSLVSRTMPSLCFTLPICLTPGKHHRNSVMYNIMETL